MDEINLLFNTFLKKYCILRRDAWINIDILHIAFLESCVKEGKTIEWVTDNLSPYEGITLKQSLLSGGLLKEIEEERIIFGIELETYPY